MLRFTLRNLLARKGRLVLSAFAIVLGVAFLAGSLIFTDTIERGFDDITEGSLSDVTVRFTGPAGNGITSARTPDERVITASEVEAMADVTGVARADGSVDGTGLFVVKPNGKLLGGTGAPTISTNVSDAPNRSGEAAITIAEGRAPGRSGEVALDRRSAHLADYELGDTVAMVTSGPVPKVEAKLVGFADFAGGGLAGATLVLFDTPTAQHLFLAGQDAYTSVGLTGEEGVSETEIVGAVTPVLPDETEAVRGEDQAAEIRAGIDTALGFLNAFLLIFAAVALVVGSFLIINTFAILVAQRSRDLALVRALGASRRQVVRSVLTEAVLVGTIGATVGLALGVGLAWLLRTLFATLGLDLSGTPLAFSVRTVGASYVVGILVTMVAAYLPARRAARVAPVSAMHEGTEPSEGPLLRRGLLGLGLAAASFAAIVAGLTSSGTAAIVFVGVGILGVLIATTLTSPVLAIPVLSVLGWLYTRVFGAIGTLAQQNSVRNLRRTASTASALMIGLALVTSISIMGSSVSRSIDVAIDEQFSSDYLVSNAIGQTFSPTIAEDLAAVEGVGDIAATQTTSLDVDGSSISATATDPVALETVVPLAYVSGSSPVDEREVALSKETATSLGLGPGDAVQLKLAAGSFGATVSGVYTSTYLVTDAVLPFASLEAGRVVRADSTVFVNADPGVDRDVLAERLEIATIDFPTVTVQDKSDYSASQRAQVDQVLYLVYALLALAIIIAVLGIVNTLALSIVERTREVGLLRAVGLSRAQLRHMIQLEAMAMALLGAFLGIVVGVLAGTMLQRVLVGQGVTDLDVPWPRLAVFVLVAVAVSVLAAVVPARRAGRLDVLHAITGH